MALNIDHTSSGIYAIVNLFTGRKYIGSAVNFKQRCQSHRYCLNKGTHHCKHLQRAWKKYGEMAFRFVVLEFVSKLFLLVETEQQYLDENEDGYNTAKFADASSRGLKRSPEMRAKMRAIALGRRHSPETCAKIGALSKNRSPETRAKLSAARRGKTTSKETRARLSAAGRGIKKSPESVAKRAAANRGQKRTLESRAKMSAAKIGKTMPPEVRERMSVSQRLRRLSEKNRKQV